MISAFLQGFLPVMRMTRSTLTTELVPINILGIWLGLVHVMRGIVGMTVAPAIGGLIWEYLGPSYVFFFMIPSMLLSLILLAAIPETLRRIRSKP
jgi:MFS family permease